MNRLLCALIISISLAGSALAQSIVTGRLLTPRTSETEDLIPLTGVWAVASPEGSAGQTITFRTWETEPVGWFRPARPAGDGYALDEEVFSQGERGEGDHASAPGRASADA